LEAWSADGGDREEFGRNLDFCRFEDFTAGERIHHNQHVPQIPPSVKRCVQFG